MTTVGDNSNLGALKDYYLNTTTKEIKITKPGLWSRASIVVVDRQEQQGGIRGLLNIIYDKFFYYDQKTTITMLNELEGKISSPDPKICLDSLNSCKNKTIALLGKSLLVTPNKTIEEFKSKRFEADLYLKENIKLLENEQLINEISDILGPGDNRSKFQQEKLDLLGLMGHDEKISKDFKTLVDLVKSSDKKTLKDSQKQILEIETRLNGKIGNKSLKMSLYNLVSKKMTIDDLLTQFSVDLKTVMKEEKQLDENDVGILKDYIRKNPTILFSLRELARITKEMGSEHLKSANREMLLVEREVLLGEIKYSLNYENPSSDVKAVFEKIFANLHNG